MTDRCNVHMNNNLRRVVFERMATAATGRRKNDLQNMAFKQ
jgi:hypothetical protein